MRLVSIDIEANVQAPRPRQMATHRRIVLMIMSVAGLVACGSDGSTSSPSAVSVVATTRPPTTTTELATPFHSDLYGYTVDSPDWHGRPATEAWGGLDSSGNLDTTADTLLGPDGRQAYVLATPTTMTVDEWAAASRAAAHANTAYPCPAGPSATAPTTVGGEPAILDEIYCPDATGDFALTAYLVHSGHAYDVLTFDEPGHEAAMRTWFGELLNTIAFDG
jgi:hypothetical protein